MHSLCLVCVRECFVPFFSDGEPEQVDKAKAALVPVATPYFEQHKKDSESVLFFYSNPNEDDIADGLVSFLKLPTSKPLLVLVNIPEQCKYICDAQELNEDAVKEFFTGYQEDTLKKSPLK